MMRFFRFWQRHVRDFIPLGAGLSILMAMLVIIARAYLAPGYQIGHDRAVPYMRVVAIQDAVNDGQFPPRWFPEFDGGYGSPYPSFYGMLFYQAAALLDACCVSLGQSVELAAFLTMAGSGLGMFFLARHLWGTPSGLLCAGLYVYAPYHLVDAFVRGAYSELAAFVWFPLIVLFVIRWMESTNLFWLLAGSCSLAGLVLTHNIMPLIFIPTVPILGAALLGRETNGPGRRRILSGWVMMAALGSLLSAFFWVPIVADRQLIRTDYFLQVQYQDEFVGLGQLLTTSIEHRLTPELGIPLVIAASCGALAASISNRAGQKKRLIASSGLLSLGFIFMMNHRSEFLWSNVSLLPFIQLPWRLLAPTAFFLSLMAGPVPAAFSSKWRQWGLAIAFPVLALQLHEPLVDMPQRIDAQDIERIETCQEVWGTQDYRPRWSDATFWRSTKAPEPSEEIPVLAPCVGTVRVLPEDSGRILASSSDGSTLTVRYQAIVPAQLEFPQYYYPSWIVRIDGESSETAPASGTGLLQVRIPAGKHEVSATMRYTGAQIAGLIFSGIGCTLAIVASAKVVFDRISSVRGPGKAAPSAERDERSVSA